MLPHRALILIREFSKPLTHPYWRFGTRHAILIKQSPIMKTIIKQIKHELRRLITSTQINTYYLNSVQTNFPGIYDYNDTDYIHKYGEELLNELSYQSVKGTHMNFYYCARNFLKDTTKFRLIQYYVKEKKYNEWILE